MEKNVRQLCLVLDYECKRALPLLTMPKDALDTYILEHFQNREEIFHFFQKEIYAYLDKNQNYLEKLYEKNHRKNTGSIVILEVTSENLPIRKSVLYPEKVQKVKNFLTVSSKENAFLKENFILFLKKQNLSSSVFSKNEIAIIQKNYAYFSKTQKKDFLFILFKDLYQRFSISFDFIREFYSLLTEYEKFQRKQKKMILETSRQILTNLDRMEVDPDKIYLDTPTIYPSFERVFKEENLDEFHGLEYQYKPYHRK